MKILLRAFNGTLQGVLDVPENTSPRFDMVLRQPIQVYDATPQGYPMMSEALFARCTFEANGREFAIDGERVRVYELVSMTRI